MSRVRIASMTWLSSLGIIVAPRPTRSLEARTQFRRHSRCRSKQNKRSARLTGKLAVKRRARKFRRSLGDLEKNGKNPGLDLSDYSEDLQELQSEANADMVSLASRPGMRNALCVVRIRCQTWP